MNDTIYGVVPPSAIEGFHRFHIQQREARKWSNVTSRPIMATRERPRVLYCKDPIEGYEYRVVVTQPGLAGVETYPLDRMGTLDPAQGAL